MNSGNNPHPFPKRLTTALMLLALPASAADWEKLPAMPEPLAGFSCGPVNGKILIAGGTRWEEGEKLWSDRIRVFDPDQRAWREAGRLTQPLAYAASDTTDDGLWFAGGSSGVRMNAALFQFDRELNVKAVAGIEPRFVFSAGAVVDEKLYVIGGAQDPAKIETMRNRCFAISLRDGTSTRIADLPAPGYVSGTAAACGGRILVFGGARWEVASSAVANLSGCFAYDPRQDRWETLTPYPFAVRGLSAVTLDAGHVYVAGGYKGDDEGFTNEAFIFDVASHTFHKAEPLPHRAMTTLVKCGAYLYCLGGEDAKKHRTDAAFRLHWKELLHELR